MPSPDDTPKLPAAIPRALQEALRGELITNDRVVTLPQGVLCGFCRGDVLQPQSEVCDGKEVKCPHCKEFMWFEVKPKEDGSRDVILHPHRRPRP